MFKQKTLIISIFSFLYLLCSPCMAEIPDSAQERQLFEQGVAFLRQGKYSESVNEFTKLISLLPDMPGAYKNRGAAYMKLGLYPLAIADFEKTLSLDEHAAGLHSNLGVAYFYQGEYQKAIEHYNQEIQYTPDSYFAYFNRSICWSNLGNLKQSLADVEKTLSIKPDLYQAVCFKGDILVEMKKFVQAKSAYEQAIKLDASQTYARDRLAELPDSSPATPPQKQKKQTQKKKHSAVKPHDHKIQIYELQAGAYGKRENAEKICETLRDLGYATRISPQKMDNGKVCYSVRTGKFISYPEAKKGMERFKKKTTINAVVKKYDAP